MRWNSMVSRHYFGTDGIRGRANQRPMTVDIALNLGKALGAVLPRRGATLKVLIGKDTRRSGYMFESALAAGINASGGGVLFTGPLPTPAIAHLTTAMRCDIGIVISASHNPYYDNGIKIFAADGFKLPDETERELERYLDDPELCQVAVTGNIGRSKRIDDATGRYNAFIKSNFERDLSLDGLKVVVDCAHGASYKIAPMVLEELGAEIVAIGTSPNGYNINDGVGALYPEACAKAVVEHGADIGISLDGDADRLILVDEQGRIVDGDDTMVMLAIDLHARGLLKRNTLVTTVMSNLGLHQALHARGIETVQTAVGDRYVVEMMRSQGYALGGEQSGHIVMLDHATTGDGLLAALRVLSLMRRTRQPLSSLASVMQHLPQVLVNFAVAKKVPLSELKEALKIIAEVEKKYGDNGRVLVRYSGTESKCRVMLEGEDKSSLERDAQMIAEAIQSEIGEA